MRPSAVRGVASVFLLSGCASVLDIDGDYRLDDLESDAGTGGAATGGAGGGATGGSGGATLECGACSASEKCCVGACVPEAPEYGCSANGCSACPPPPANGFATCAAGQCSFACGDGFVKSGNACVSAGSGGDGGSGGGTPTCSADQCPPCVDQAIYSPCCKDDGECGCRFPFAPCF